MSCCNFWKNIFNKSQSVDNLVSEIVIIQAEMVFPSDKETEV